MSKLGRLDLIRAGNLPIFVPDAVLIEISALGSNDHTLQEVRSIPWLQIVPTLPTPEAILPFRLGAGEASVLALALSLGDSDVVLDDLAARRCAKSLGVPLQGTIGLLLQAKRLGMIPAVRPALEELRTFGMYLSDRLFQEALAAVHEL